MTIETSIGLETGQPYPYARVELVEPDWTRFPGWRDVTAAEWASVQWQRAHCIKNVKQLRELMGDLLGANRTASDVFSITAFRPEKASNNETRFFSPQPQSIAPTKIAFIGTGATASASELVINSFVPYVGDRAALIGTNTFGKPVGQIGIDRPSCDDRLRVVAFATQNRDRQGDYYDGLRTTVRASCAMRAPR